MNGFVLFWKYTHVRLFLFLSSGLGGSSKALIKVIITIDNDDDDKANHMALPSQQSSQVPKFV